MHLEVPEAPSGVPGDEGREQDHHGYDGQCGERELHVQKKHRREDADERQHARQKGGDVLGHDLVDRIDVVGEPAHQFAGRRPVEEGDREDLQPGEEIPPEEHQRVLRDRGHPAVGQGAQKVREDVRGEHRQGNLGEALRPARDDVPVYRRTHQPRAGKPEQGVPGHHREDEDETAPIRPQVSHEPCESAPGIARLLDPSHHGGRPSGTQHASCVWRPVSRVSLHVAHWMPPTTSSPSCES